MQPPVRTGLAAAFADTFQVIFLAALPLAVLAFVAALLLKQIPMRRGEPAEQQPDASPGTDEPDAAKAGTDT